ncbi:DUF255 domain-containing protein [candidate division KSB1 bacterium]|nr:DUF255 domain-containing protein [candidate division KSB1 bacterium]
MLNEENSEDFKHTNKLIHETSPYLLQHAHNPVNWYPWDEEALERSATENKPIFLSIGYSACHWCHVMEKESFEDEDIARILNEHFINIKVDREERPDIDEIYMTAVQLMNQHGGWPLSVWLTPDRKPFFGGTYFPPEDRMGRMGFKNLLKRITELWQQKNEDLLNSADEIAKHLHTVNKAKSSDFEIDPQVWDQAFSEAEKNYDPQFGGFGHAPKFPQAIELSFLMRYYFHTAQKQALDIAESSLRGMMYGGIRDHIGGGFHRYSTDRHWLVPHFEKMLYDNALLTIAYLEAFQLTGHHSYADTAAGILDYVLHEMAAPEGGYYSSQDADSEGQEGKYFVWSRQEVESILNKQVARIFCDFYGVTKNGNWDGVNILHQRRTVEMVARDYNMSPENLHSQLEQARQTLLSARQRRIPPDTDDKILTAWNSLMISAMCKGYQVLADEKYLRSAETSVQFIFQNLYKKEKLLRSYRSGQSKFDAYLSDYAFLTAALLDLYETTFDMDYLQHAFSLNDRMIDKFWDQKASGFYFTAHDHEQLLIRSRKAHDSAVPSGNSVAISNLLRIAAFQGNDRFRQMALDAAKLSAEQLQRLPFGFPSLISSFDFLWGESKEIVITGSRNSQQTQEMKAGILHKYLPNKILVHSDLKNGSNLSLPVLEGKESPEDRSLIYVCENYTCKQPFSTIKEFEEYYAGLIK